MVLCHGVLEVVPDPVVALRGIADVLRPGGVLSLVVAQRYAAVVARAMAGHLEEALAMLDSTASHGRVGRRFTADEVLSLVADAGFDLTSIHGTRVFADLVPGALQDADHHATTALHDLERAVAGRPEFLALATQLHLVASWSGSEDPLHG
jgi:SAM-dependent methyltransferase